MMDALDIGRALIALCKDGRFMVAIERYYADDIVSIEAMSIPGMERITTGIESVRAKNAQWAVGREVNKVEAEGPFLAEGTDAFAVFFCFDVTNTETGERYRSNEVAIYRVADGKIAEERFFFPESSFPPDYQ